MLNKAIGSMIGCAVGDALGVAVEFCPRDSYDFLEYYRKSVKFNLPVGAYTDDTSQMLCLAQSFLDKKTDDPIDQLEKYLKWLNKGYMSAAGKAVGCGLQTHRALTRFQSKRESICNIKRKKGAGNGSLMRVAPIAIFYQNDLLLAINSAKISSYTTHGLKICADACMLFVAMIVLIYQGLSKEEVLSEEVAKYLLNLLPNYQYDDEITKVILGSYKEKSRDEISSSGYVVSSLEATLWAFYNSKDFKDGLLKAVNLGDDSDTVGAIYGTIAGAYYGVQNIEQRYIDELINHKLIITKAKELYENRYDK